MSDANETVYCDFMVWSPSGICHMEQIVINNDFIEEKLQQAEKLFWLAIMPELLGKWYTRKHTKPPRVTLKADEEEEDDGSCCYCQEGQGGKKIACENPSCTIKWFHKKCLRITQDPRANIFVLVVTQL